MVTVVHVYAPPPPPPADSLGAPEALVVLPPPPPPPHISTVTYFTPDGDQLVVEPVMVAVPACAAGASASSRRLASENSARPLTVKRESRLGISELREGFFISFFLNDWRYEIWY
jgi:hypothetical protein